MKRRGNRRYYQHHEVLMIRRIRDLLYDEGFTISGARNKLQEIVQTERDKRRNGEVLLEGVDDLSDAVDELDALTDVSELDGNDSSISSAKLGDGMSRQRLEIVRRELTEIRDLLAA
jgi:DNA-binding transcriptional MerR regulator